MPPAAVPPRANAGQSAHMKLALRPALTRGEDAFFGHAPRHYGAVMLAVLVFDPCRKARGFAPSTPTGVPPDALSLRGKRISCAAQRFRRRRHADGGRGGEAPRLFSCVKHQLGWYYSRR